MKRVVVFSCVVMFACNGCFTAAKRGLKELRGASGKVIPVKECDPAFCASVGTVKLGDVTNSIAPVCPPDVFMKIKSGLAARAADASEELEGSGSAVLDVDISFYKRPGGLLAVAGKSGLLIGRAAVKDDAGRQQGDLLIAVSSEAMRTGRSEMVDVFSRTLVGHVARRADDDRAFEKGCK